MGVINAVLRENVAKTPRDDERDLFGKDGCGGLLSRTSAAKIEAGN